MFNGEIQGLVDAPPGAYHPLILLLQYAYCIQHPLLRLAKEKDEVGAEHGYDTQQGNYTGNSTIFGNRTGDTFSDENPHAISLATSMVLNRTKSGCSVDLLSACDKVFPFLNPFIALENRERCEEMGCSASKLDNEDTVRRCKERRRLMKEAVYSHSSFSSSPPPHHDFTYNARANSTYSSTPSQTSSVWNWDNFYPPPSPPSSEHFQQLHKNKNPTAAPIDDINSDDDDRYTDNDNDDKASSFTSYSNIRDQRDQYHNPFSSDHGKEFDDRASSYSSFSRYPDNSYPKNHIRQGPAKKVQNLKRWESEDEEETEREEVQCSEWGDHDHYTSTTSSSDEGERDDLKSRSDFGTRSNFNEASSAAAAAKPANMGNANVNLNSKFSTKSEKLSSEDDGKSSVSWGDGNNQRVNSDRRIVVRHKDLAEIVEAIREYFDKAALAGEQVSEMLETGRAQLDRSFKQLRTPVGLQSLRWQLNTGSSEFDRAIRRFKEPLLHFRTPLGVGEKLYEEVKRRSKIEHEKKLSSLQSQEYKGEDESKVDKTKASINRLQSLIVVTSQAVSTTSSAIIGLRDSDLVPQLVELCHGFMYMWRSMNQFHEIQNNIVQQVRGLVNHTNKGQSTSDLHRQATRDLESAVSAWHSSFCRLVKFQRDFVQSLHGWFKLTLLPVHSEPTNGQRELSNVFAFCDEWKLAPTGYRASEAIKSFINVVHSISLKQTEELKIKKRTETASKELEKKASSLRSIEKKYYHSYSMVGIGLPDTGPDSRHVLDARDPLSEKKAELATCQRRVEDEMQKHSRQ
ncbi:LOW QUALITY PROTEIN: hypothetical protein DH2020_046904 [Rehmannia glutinosa]|uniref:DUF632 domain-containing protein n=1 Tax=Rehmannia glutinosa TaxID=99300 RepID=A0ABR0UAX5_REHGL